MFDLHYDLLTNILMKKDNFSSIKDYCQKVYNKQNIKGGIFNLFYMSKTEMNEELGFNESQIDVINNLEEVNYYINKYELIPSDTKYLIGIEGLDFLKSLDDIDTLYSLGLRSANPVWNNKNKFGGGSKSDNTCGLTDLGELLIKRLVKKGIAIDLSHTNETTFFDIVNLCKKLKSKGEKPIVFASHSNAKAICNVPRNLTDEQILSIKDLGGIIGVVSIKNFCVDTQNIKNPNINFEQIYISHINYIKNLLGGVDNIAVATDDMKYYFIEPEYYQNINIFSHFDIKKRLTYLLSENGYNSLEIEKILEKNFLTLCYSSGTL